VTVVVMMPICWVIAARNSMAAISAKPPNVPPERGLAAIRRSRQAKGRSVRVASANFAAVKVHGPTASMAVDWATKPMPHMAPARRRTRLAWLRDIGRRRWVRIRKVRS